MSRKLLYRFRSEAAHTAASLYCVRKLREETCIRKFLRLYMWKHFCIVVKRSRKDNLDQDNIARTPVQRYQSDCHMQRGLEKILTFVPSVFHNISTTTQTNSALCIFGLPNSGKSHCDKWFCWGEFYYLSTVTFTSKVKSVDVRWCNIFDLLFSVRDHIM